MTLSYVLHRGLLAEVLAQLGNTAGLRRAVPGLTAKGQTFVMNIELERETRNSCLCAVQPRPLLFVANIYTVTTVWSKLIVRSRFDPPPLPPNTHAQKNDVPIITEGV